MSKPANPPAFPRTSTSFASNQDGMTLRDWFAGQVMAGLLASASAKAETWEEYAADAYEVADALLTERERGQ